MSVLLWWKSTFVAPVMLCNTLCQWFYLLLNSLRVHSLQTGVINRWCNSFCLLWSTSVCFCPLLGLLFYLWHIVVSPASPTVVNKCRNLDQLHWNMFRNCICSTLKKCSSECVSDRLLANTVPLCSCKLPYILIFV